MTVPHRREPMGVFYSHIYEQHGWDSIIEVGSLMRNEHKTTCEVKPSFIYILGFQPPLK